MREISVTSWQPRYTLTPAMARRLMEIEAARGTELTEELILTSYYNSLAVHPHHNYYYEGRDTADLTSWWGYFLAVLASAVTSIKDEIVRLGHEGSQGEPEELAATVSARRRTARTSSAS